MTFSINFRNIITVSLSIIAFVFIFSSCEKTKSCPDGNLCVEGNVLEYQSSNERAKITIEAPEGAVYANTAIIITDMVPFYPANADYGTYKRHFAGGMFNIQPTDLDLKKFLTISIEYTAEGITTYIGDNFEEDLVLYFIDEDENWSIVNASSIDVEKDKVFAQVTRLGVYAVGAPKDCIIGEWRYGTGIGNYFYNMSYTFNNQGKGKREIVSACNEELTEYDVITMEFSWRYDETDNDKIDLYNFGPATGCGEIGGLLPDMQIEFECSESDLVIDDGSIVTYYRVF